MKKGFLLVVIVFFANMLVAGNGNNNKDKDNVKLISGKVIDKKSGEEIAGAEIKINDKIVYTDLNGNFSASIIPAKIEALVTSISYNETKINIDPFSYNTIVVEFRI